MNEKRQKINEAIQAGSQSYLLKDASDENSSERCFGAEKSGGYYFDQLFGKFVAGFSIA